MSPISMCPPASNRGWIHTARHEAGHAVAFILASLDIYLNPYGCAGVQIRPGRTNFVRDRRGRPHYCVGYCEGLDMYSPVGADNARRRAALDPSAVPQQVVAAEWAMVGCFAGPCADVVSRGVRGRNSMFWNALLAGGCGGDFEQADRIFEDLRVLAGRRAGREKLRDRARKLVLANWLAIDALAMALLDQHQLDGAEVREIVVPHLIYDQALAPAQAA